MKLLSVLAVLIGVICAYSQEYKFPGKYLFCVKERRGLTNVKEMRQFQDKVAEIIINNRWLEIYQPKGISSNQLLEIQQLGAGKFSEASHAIYCGLNIDYRPNKKKGGEFFVSGFLSIEKLENGVATGEVWRQVDARVQSSGYNLEKIESQEDEYPRKFCVDKLAEILAERMIDKIITDIKQMKEFTAEEPSAPKLHIDEKTRDILEKEVARLNKDEARKQRLRLLKNFTIELLSFVRDDDDYWLARYRITNDNAIALQNLIGKFTLANADHKVIAKSYQAFRQEFSPGIAIVREKRWPYYKYPQARHFQLKLVAFISELKKSRLIRQKQPKRLQPLDARSPSSVPTKELLQKFKFRQIYAKQKRSYYYLFFSIDNGNASLLRNPILQVYLFNTAGAVVEKRRFILRRDFLPGKEVKLMVRWKLRHPATKLLLQAKIVGFK